MADISASNPPATRVREDGSGPAVDPVVPELSGSVGFWPRSAVKPVLALHPEVPAVREAVCGGRVKYTCVSASASFLVCGSNTGGLYCFRREDGKFVQVIQHKVSCGCQCFFHCAAGPSGRTDLLVIFPLTNSKTDHCGRRKDNSLL